MFQTFTVTARPDQGPPRLAALRDVMAAEGLEGWLVPKADLHQGEYVAPCDDRLAWLTGFTGSAGFAAVLADRAGVFVDGRYRVQVRKQVAAEFSPVDWPDTDLGDWLVAALPDGGTVGFDPWLHTVAQIDRLTRRLDGTGVTLVALDNLVDRVWTDRPPRPAGPVEKYPADLAGKGDETKRAELVKTLRDAKQAATVLTLPDSICWLLNIRGADIPRIPIVQAVALVRADGGMDLVSDPAKFAPLGPDPKIELYPWDALDDRLRALPGPVRLDRDNAPEALRRILDAAGIAIDWAAEPCQLPKACKTGAELAATTDAHIRDGAAMVEFLCWLDAAVARGDLTEIDVVVALEGARRDTGALRDISFDTIAGAGPNGAIVHYRVSAETNRTITPGDILLVDSGGQYLDGTTDITRTIATGPADPDAVRAFTLVLKGMIAISRARFPRGVAGAHLDSLARNALWQAGLDFDHGTGHGVGVYLSVHEGPQRLSRVSDVPLQPGMILSNEPGYYREGAFGIRIENLVVVEQADPVPGQDDRDWLGFSTLTLAPIDRRLIDRSLLDSAEIAWLDQYHAEVARFLTPRVTDAAARWLAKACAPL